MFLLEEAAAVAEEEAAAALMSEEEAVDPVAVRRSACTVASWASTDALAVARLVPCVVSEAISVVVQVTVTPVTVAASVEIWVEVAISLTMTRILAMFVMTSAQEVTTALMWRPVELPVREEVVFEAAARPAELAVRAAASASREVVLEAHEDIAFMPSSSIVLQAEKFPLQYPSWAVTFLFALETLQPLIVVLASTVKLALSQQEQAAVSFVIIMHASTIPTKVVIAVLQAITSVMLGMREPKLLLSHAALILASHAIRVLVTLVSCAAPELLVFPLQVRADLFPPPLLMIRMAVVAKIPFFPCLLVPVLFALVILVCCLR